MSLRNNLQRVRLRQNIGCIIGIIVGVILVVIFLLPSQARLHVKGEMNTGHEELSCQSCHKLAPGSARQQIQANVRYWLDLRKTGVDFGNQDVTNGVCLDCHDRPNDRHPVFRFVEPRFKEARENIQPQFCISCHLEHQGKRVTIGVSTYCVNCHEDTRLKNDPITIAHEELIAAGRWESCLACHDFHGNHVMETNTVVEEAFTIDQIRKYFEGGPSPYPDELYHEAKRGNSDDQQD